MPFLKSIIKFLRPVILFPFRTYWFIFRPHTRGAKIVLVCAGEMLLLQPTYGYALTLPGGGLNKGESPAEGIKREVFEELGINITEPKFLGSFISTAEYKKDEVFAFTATVSDKKVTLDIETESATWYPLNGLPKTGTVTA